MKQTIYLMRHGQTLFNKNRMIQGFCDSPLTPLGVHQAKTAGQWFTQHQLHFSHAYTSTLARTSDTLEYALPNVPYTRLKGIKEWNCGDVEGKSEAEYSPKTYPYNDYYQQYGGETQTEFTKRVVETMNEIVTNDHHANILVVAHGLVLKVFGDYCAKPAQKMQVRGIKNCTIFKFEYDREQQDWDFVDIVEHTFE